MTISAALKNDPASLPHEQTQVESVRYALIRRLGLIFRHHLVGTLQPISVMSQVMQLKLRLVPSDVSALTDSVSKTGGLVRTAIDSCLDVMSWISADAQATTVDAGVGVAECVTHLRSSFSFHGFAMACDASSMGVSVDRSALREVLTAVLFATADHARGLSHIAVDVQAISDTVEITVHLQPGNNPSTPDAGAYRLLQWDEVEALAMAHEVGLRRVDDDLVKIRLSPFIDSSRGA